jgi:NAD/NADP transhydrogenase beta subunit
MDLSKLSKPDRILAGAGAVFVLSTLLPWFSLDGFGGALNGLDYGLWGVVPLLIVFGIVGWIAAKRFTTTALPGDIPALYLAGGAAVLLLPLLKFLIGQGDGIRGVTLDFDRSIGLFLAVFAGAGFAFGAFLKFLEGGGKVDELKGQMSTLAGQVNDKARTAVNEAKESGTNKPE